MTAYRIADEPLPSRLGSIVVDPLWPLLAVMFVGPVMSWPWFVLNGHAVGSPSRHRETAWAVGGFVVTLALAVALLLAGGEELLGPLALRYAGVGLTVAKLLVSYRLYQIQARSFHLYEHFGGTVRSGILAVVLGWALSEYLLRPLPILWRVVLS